MAEASLKSAPRAQLPTRFGTFTVYGFEDEASGEQAVALVAGEPAAEDAKPLVRIHSQCFTGDTLHSLRCDCGQQLEAALQAISADHCGVLIYQMQEGRGIGLINKLRAYELQDLGHDTVDANLQLGFDADQRNYNFCSQILNHLGVKAVRLMSNNPRKIEGLEEAGIRVLERVPLVVAASKTSAHYLKTKKEKLGHLLED